MKKRLALLLLFPLMITCATLGITQKPEAHIETFKIDSITLRDITFLFDIGIKNHYPVGIKLDRIAVNLKIEGKQFFKTTTSRGLKLKARGTTTSSFKLNIKYLDIMRIIRAYTRKDYLNCTIDLAVIIPLPAFVQKLKKNITLHYTLKKKIPAIKPSLRIVNFKVEKPSLKEIAHSLEKNTIDNVTPDNIFGMFNDLLSGKRTRKLVDPKKLDIPITVSFDIELKNNTRARLLFKELQYNFFINNNNLISGDTDSIQTAGNKSIISVKNKFSSRALAQSVISAFRYKRGAYILKGVAALKLPNSISRRPVPMKFNEKGNFNLK